MCNPDGCHTRIQQTSPGCSRQASSINRSPREQISDFPERRLNRLRKDVWIRLASSQVYPSYQVWDPFVARFRASLFWYSLITIDGRYWDQPCRLFRGAQYSSRSPYLWNTPNTVSGKFSRSNITHWSGISINECIGRHEGSTYDEYNNYHFALGKGGL